MNRVKRELASICMSALAIASPGLVRGAESSQGLFGDWGGIRSTLTDHGIDLEVTYTNELANNVSGGAAQETADADQYYVGSTLDLKRLIGIPGAKIIVSFTNRNGESLSLKAHLNTLLEVQEIYGEGNWTRLNQLYWEQQLFDDKVLLKLGRISGTFDFMPFSCYFQNITFCANLLSHNVVDHWVAFPGGTWAGVARFKLKNDWYVKAGVYEINPDFTEHKYRFALGSPFGGLGKRVVAEVGWLPAAAGPDGGYRLGTWYDDVGGSDLYLNSAGLPLVTNGGTPLQHEHESGFYAMAQQRVWVSRYSDSRSLSLFMNFVQTDHHITAIGQIAEIGLFWTGPFSFRPQDDLSVAIGQTRLNSRVTAGETLYNAEVAVPYGLPQEPVQHAEYPMEIHYSVNLTPAVTIRPNVQLIHAPGGVSERANIVVFGLHTFVKF